LFLRMLEGRADGIRGRNWHMHLAKAAEQLKVPPGTAFGQSNCWQGTNTGDLEVSRQLSPFASCSLSPPTHIAVVRLLQRTTVLGSTTSKLRLGIKIEES
jgi:hypothetical protein